VNNGTPSLILIAILPPVVIRSSDQMMTNFLLFCSWGWSDGHYRILTSSSRNRKP
jgi:hypothetical protein